MKLLIAIMLLTSVNVHACVYCENIKTGEKKFICEDKCRNGWKPAYSGPGWADKTTTKSKGKK